MYFCLPACTGTSCPRCFVAISIFWSGIFSDPLASLEQATAFHYKQVMVQHVQHRPEHRTGKGVRDHLSCGTGAKVGLRRSFKKYVCITDDLLEEITVLSHYFYRIWPALHCTGLISVQLGWLLCIQWQKSTRRQEEPDSLQLRTVFWELTALFAWKIMLFPLLACVNGVRDFFFFFLKTALFTWCLQWIQSFIRWFLKIRPTDPPSRLNSPAAIKMHSCTAMISILERECLCSHLCGWSTGGPIQEGWRACA